jgi:diacylglycerol kinase family enzyme
MRRAAAAAALAALVAALLYLAISAIFRWYTLLASVISLGVAVVAVWFILSRRGLARALAAVVAAVALVTFIGIVIATESLVVLMVGLGLAAVSIMAASYALSPISAPVDVNKRAPRAHHPVLLMNLRSGGGKAERFGLAELCRERGIEPVILNPGDDLRQLAEAAVSRGADLLGMAGGDGSLALVASIASQHGIPFVVIPAGTRNHLALDLGLDRTNLPGALQAFEDGADTTIDLAEVNGRVFVNNVSMGVYARIVQSADYRNAKVQTAAAMLPDLLGPEATPLDVRFTLPSGQEAAGAQLLLVSNNPYQLAQLRGGGTRERLDGGALGIVYVRVESAADAERLAALEVAGQVQRFAAWNEWTAPQFEVRSGGPVEIGIDGEAMILEPPLRFVIRPRALTVRLPRTAPKRSPATRAVRLVARPTVVTLWQTVLGRPTGAG